jgi:Zn-dependent protease with chaperone function
MILNFCVITISDLKWEFHVIESSEMNAFVLPGGKVFVFTGILPIVKNEDGLAAVLGHEVGKKFIFLKTKTSDDKHISYFL